MSIRGTKLICPCGREGFWSKEDFEKICAFVCPGCGRLHTFSEDEKRQVIAAMEEWPLEEAGRASP